MAVAFDSVPQLAVHVTAVLAVLSTVAVKACTPPGTMPAVAGDTETETVCDAVTVTMALAVLVLSAWLAAVTVQLPAAVDAV